MKTAARALLQVALFLQFALFLALGCAPSPRVLRSYNADLVGYAEMASSEHKNICTAPVPGAPATPPPRCDALQSCLDAGADAARHCSAAISHAGQPRYQAEAFACAAQVELARALCVDAGVRPVPAAPLAPVPTVTPAGTPVPAALVPTVPSPPVVPAPAPPAPAVPAPPAPPPAVPAAPRSP